MILIEALYRPAARVPRTWIDPKASAGGNDTVPIPFVDEDEATMAMGAIEPLLVAAGLEPTQLDRVFVSSRTGSGFGSLLATALGLAPERMEEVPSEPPSTLASAGQGPVLRVQSDAWRPGSVPPEGVGEGAQAVAQLIGPGLPAHRRIEVPVVPWTPERETMEKLARWEQEAPQRVPMGAYIPYPTWEQDAPARYRLEASACSEGHREFPPRPRCGHCRRPTNRIRLARRGRLETFTVVAKGAGPSEFEPLQDVVGEYAVAVASFEGVRVPGLMVETPLDSLRIGLPVVPVLRRLYAQEGRWRYGLKFHASPQPAPAKNK